MRIKTIALSGVVPFLLTAFLGQTVMAENVTGAGATFPAPIYMQWADGYKKATGNEVAYQSLGSSAGIKQIRAKTVDFGATDAPLSDEQLAADGLFQFPTVMGGLVLAVNLPGLKAGDVTLTGQLVADIYMGKITKWNDPAIQALNKGVPLPNKTIQVVYRADGSGTTSIFTGYLSAVSADWKKDMGANTTVNWKVGLGGKGNEGVAAFVGRLEGSIGYVEYAYAKKGNLIYAAMTDANGSKVMPSDGSFKIAAAGANWAQSLTQDLNNSKASGAWPIVGPTYILLRKDNKEASARSMKFFEWAFKNGDSAASELIYVPMPESVKKSIAGAYSKAF